MDILEQLETRVVALMGRLDSLAKENARLKEQIKKAPDMETANRSLREELAGERQKSQAALTRVEAILQRMKDLPE